MSPALSRGAAEKALSHLRTMAPQTIESVKPAIAALTTRLQQDSQPAVSLLQRMSGNRWCVSSKTYSLQLLTGSIIWRDNAGSVDVESIVSNGTTDARTVTQKSSHPEGKSEEVGTSWNYRLASPDKIYVNSSNKDPSKNKSFSLSRC